MNQLTPKINLLPNFFKHTQNQQKTNFQQLTKFSIIQNLTSKHTK